jgi:hypothetical protein
MIGDVEEMDRRTAIIHMWMNRNIMKSAQFDVLSEYRKKITMAAQDDTTGEIAKCYGNL